MTIVESGKDLEGRPAKFYMDPALIRSLDLAKDRVKKRNWDYVSIISGIPGSGKSTLARCLARYCCPWFDLPHVAFTVDEFIKLTNNCPEYSSVILDESFQSLNSRVTMSPAFLRIINHLQIIRQKHLFIFLCLPNFFDLSKGVAIFRASHLFVTYASNDGKRGKYLAWDRSGKRRLYIRGQKYLNYNAVVANVRGKFITMKKIMSEVEYEKKKRKHLMDQEQTLIKKGKHETDKERIAIKLYKMGWKYRQIYEFVEVDKSTLYNWRKKHPETWGIK